jgi:fatty acid desaturase
MEAEQSPPSAPETAEALLAALRRLEAEGRLHLRIEPALLTHIDSPVASEADGNIWVYGALAVAAALWLWRGAVPGLVAFAAGLVVYFTLGRRYMHRRVERRVRERALENLETWRRLWRFRGLTLSAAGRAGPADCASPEGNWMAFVRALG